MKPDNLRESCLSLKTQNESREKEKVEIFPLSVGAVAADTPRPRSDALQAPVSYEPRPGSHALKNFSSFAEKTRRHVCNLKRRSVSVRFGSRSSTLESKARLRASSPVPLTLAANIFKGTTRSTGFFFRGNKQSKACRAVALRGIQ